MRPFSVVILAAGESSRLGRPKQLVEIDGVPLVRRAVDVAWSAGPLEVIVVLGAYGGEILQAVGGPGVAASSVPPDQVVDSIGLGASTSSGAPSRPSFPSHGPSRKPREPAPFIVFNQNWREGMASSIRVGMEAVDASSEAVVLMLCDQPRVNGELLLGLLAALDEADGISATEYEGRAGAPCAFVRSHFQELLKLRGDRGARDLIRDPTRHVVLAPFEAASVDIDTQSDVDALP